jgi:hypothetical protein
MENQEKTIQEEEINFLDSKRKSLSTVIDLIRKNYKIDFVIEQVVYDTTKTVFFLKRKREINFWIKKYYVFDYETNSIPKRISFKTLADIEIYLRQQFSEPEGFITESLDVN